MIIISFWFLPQVYFYTFTHNTQSKSLQDKLSQKVRDVSKGGGRGGSPEKRPHDVSPDKIDMCSFPNPVEFGVERSYTFL